MHSLGKEFAALETVVVAVSQEDDSLEAGGQMAQRFPDRNFEIVHDVDRSVTQAYDRTTAYLIDRHGVVRQIFPMVIHARPSWRIVLGEVESMPTSGGGATRVEPESR